MNLHYLQNVQKERCWHRVKDVYVTRAGSRFCTRACTISYNNSHCSWSTPSWVWKHQNLNLWLTNTTWQKFRFSSGEAWGLRASCSCWINQAMRLDLLMTALWPLSLPCLGPTQSQHWPLVRIVCLTALAGDTRISGSRGSRLFQNVPGGELCRTQTVSAGKAVL